MGEPRDAQAIELRPKRQLSASSATDPSGHAPMEPAAKRRKDELRVQDLHWSQASGSTLVHAPVQLQGENVNIYGNVYSANNISISTNYIAAPDATQEGTLYSRLQPSARADYKYGLTSGEKQKLSRDICTPGTRKKVLEEIIAWVEDSHDPLFLLCGPAGSGKSTIAYTTAHLFDRSTKDDLKAAMKLDRYPIQGVILAANFFCSRHFEETSRISAIITTIAYQLALKDQAFAVALQDFEAAKHGVDSQIEHLLLKPLRSSKSANPHRQVIIIEAIDELGMEDSHRFLQSLIKSLQHNPPMGLKFIVTSREEGGLMKLADSLPQKRIYRLQEVNKAEVEADIRTYMLASLSNIDPTELEKAVTYAGGLFICAATIVRYLEPHRRTPKNRDRKLRTLIDNLNESSRGLDAMDDLYRQILREALCELEEDPDLLADYLSTLHTFLCTLIPASPSTAAMLANTGPDEENDVLLSEIAGDVLLRLHAVLYTDGQGHVLPYHKSFPDFIFDLRRAGPYHCNRTSFNSQITASCFRIMQKELRFNIADIETSFGLDEDVPDLDERVKTNISPALAYVCQFWSHHLDATEATGQSSFHHSLSFFLQIKALFWLEVMNLLGQKARCEALFRLARSWVLRASTLNPKLAQQLFDAASFALYFAASPASTSTPHLYISALATWPRDNDLPSTWRRWFPHIPRLEYRGEPNRTLVNISVGSRVLSSAISNDGTTIVSGCQNGVVQLWDVATGDLVVKLEGHARDVNSVAFSRDGTRVVSGSDDNSVRIWDVLTGTQAIKLEGHADSVTSVAFSSDGTRIVSGSWDKSVRIWETLAGTRAIKLEGHTASVTSVAFFSDGTRVVSGSWDKTVRIWDALTGTQAIRLEGHTEVVTSVALSSNGTHVVSGSWDISVRIWDALTGMQAIKLEAHTESVTSVAFSSDGTRVISGSADNSVRIWDVLTGTEAVKLEGHTELVTSVAFSSDGTRVVSGSQDQSVRIWDVLTGTHAVKLEDAESVTSVAFSSDGTRVVSGSWDKSVQIWDALTGTQTVKLEGQTERVSSVAFSSDGNSVVSGSWDNSLRIWDVLTGMQVVKLEGHAKPVTSVAFSSDGIHVVSGSQDESARIWKVLTGTQAVKLEGHTHYVKSVAFSSDGTRVVSGSVDKSVRIWDVLTGTQVIKLDRHARPVYSVAFSSDGSRVFSASQDESVSIWDLLKGTEVVKLEGHSNGRSSTSIAFSSDGTRVVSGSWDNSVRIWDVLTGTPAVRLEGHTDKVFSVAFSSDGTRAVSGSWDKSVRIWHVPQHGSPPPYILQRSLSGSIPTGWLLSPSATTQNYLMYVSASAQLVAYPMIICISRTPHSVLSPFDYDYLGENWTQCYSPQPSDMI